MRQAEWTGAETLPPGRDRAPHTQLEKKAPPPPEAAPGRASGTRRPFQGAVTVQELPSPKLECTDLRTGRWFSKSRTRRDRPPPLPVRAPGSSAHGQMEAVNQTSCVPARLGAEDKGPPGLTVQAPRHPHRLEIEGNRWPIRRQHSWGGSWHRPARGRQSQGHTSEGFCVSAFLTTSCFLFKLPEKSMVPALCGTAWAPPVLSGDLRRSPCTQLCGKDSWKEVSPRAASVQTTCSSVLSGEDPSPDLHAM